MSNRLKTNIYAFITVFIWATAFPVTKIIGDELSPNSVSLIRCATAAVFMLVVGGSFGMKKPASGKDGLTFAAAGIMGFALYLIFFTKGIGTLTSATSSVIIALTPVMTAIAATKVFKEKINKVGWAAIGTAFVGVMILMFWQGTLSVNEGILWTLLGAVMFATYNIISRFLTKRGYTSIEIVAYGMLAGAFAMLWAAPGAMEEMSSTNLATVFCAVYLGLMPSAISYMLWAKAMSFAEKTSEVTNYMFVTPMLSTLLGFAMLGELPDAGTYIGGAIIIAAVVIFGLKGKE